MNDPFRERTLAELNVTASVTTEPGVCVIRMTIENFDRMMEGVEKTANQPDWLDEVKDGLDTAEAALQEVAHLIRSAERKAEKTRRQAS